MTLSPVQPDLDGHRDAVHDWAVVEIRQDGTLGPAELVTAPGPVEAAQLSCWRRDSTPVVGNPALDSMLGLLQASGGHLTEARQTFTQGLRSAPQAPGRGDCLGPLALIETYQGDLHRATQHADMALADDTASTSGHQHARLAQAWIHLERARHTECERDLELVEPPLHPDDHWLATARLLVEAGLLVATHRPDAAARILTTPTDPPGPTSSTAWVHDMLVTTRADALLAAGEPHRALAMLTPLPTYAVAAASVTTAVGRRAVGDIRGANAVLGSALAALEHAPLSVQIRAWLLRARLAEDLGDLENSRVLVDRALHEAAAEDLRTALLRDGEWLRMVLARDPELHRTHRDFLGGDGLALHSATPVHRVPPADLSLGGPNGASLTQREAQVLELLAQMYSTEEIAGELYVSVNTVKTHLKGIFWKLSVSRRVDAVRRGRTLGLC